MSSVFQIMQSIWSTVLAYWDTLKELIQSLPAATSVTIAVVLAVAIVYLVAGR